MPSKPTIKLSQKQAQAVANKLGTLVCPKKNNGLSRAENGIALRKLPQAFRKKSHTAPAFRLTANEPEPLRELMATINANGKSRCLCFTEVDD